MNENYNSLMFAETGKFDEMSLRRRDDIFISPSTGFNAAENARRVRGIYRPIRNLPVAFKRGNRNDYEGYILAQGKFVSKYDVKVHDGTAWRWGANTRHLGVANINNGQFYAFINARTGSAELVDFDSPLWGNGRDIQGLIGPANGMNSAASDTYTALDTEYNSIDPVTGNVINAGDNASLRDTWDNNFRLTGVAIADTLRETRNNNASYQRKIEAITVAKEGYLVIPFVVADSTTISALDTAPSMTSNQYLASRNQVVLWVDNAGLLLSQASLRIDAYGNPVLTNSANYNALPEGAVVKLVDFAFNYSMPFGLETDTYPGLDVAGKNSSGVDFPVYSIAKKLQPNYSISQMREYVDSGLFGYAHIYYNIP